MDLNLTANYYAEIDILCLILLILLLVKTQRSYFISSQKATFSVVLISHIIFTFSDLIWIFNNNFIPLLEFFPKHGITISYIFNGLDMAFSGITGISWLIFSEHIQGYKVNRNKSKVIIALIPIVVLFILLISTRHTHFMFYIDEYGNYIQGPGYFIQMFFSYGYIVMASLFSLYHAKKAKSIQERKLSLNVAFFAVMPLIAGILQIIFTNIQVLFLGTVVGLLNVYISLQKLQVLTDPLTGLNNRLLLDQKIDVAIKGYDDSQDLYLLLFDADNFKKINDTYGHVVGDVVLTMIADVLRKNCGSADYVCRFGGDEFVLLHYAPKGEGCFGLLKKIDDMLALYDYPCKVSVSAGFCKYTKDIKDLDMFIDVADENMYQNKASKKNLK